jgi:hypothetical protein
MNPLDRLRFKIATSFAIAALGIIMFVHLALMLPLSLSTLLPFLAPIIFVIAGVWRGLIFIRAVRGLAKS